MRIGWLVACIVLPLAVGCQKQEPLKVNPQAEADYQRRKALAESTEPYVVPEHLVLVRLKLRGSEESNPQERKDIEKLAATMRKLVEGSSIGEYDGGSFAAGYGDMFFYGPDGDKLYLAILGTLKQYKPAAGSHVIVRYGPRGATEKRFDL